MFFGGYYRDVGTAQHKGPRRCARHAMLAELRGSSGMRFYCMCSACLKLAVVLYACFCRSDLSYITH